MIAAVQFQRILFVDESKRSTEAKKNLPHYDPEFFAGS